MAGAGMGMDINSSKSYAKTDASASKSGDIRTGNKVFNTGAFSGDSSMIILAAVAVIGIYLLMKKG